MNKDKIIIYQLLPRLFTNRCPNCVPNGTIKQNGSGKFNDIDSTVLASIRNLGITHIWYTGIIEHATRTDYSDFGIAPDNPHIVKGNAGSPYAIKDYYDVDPDLAVDIDHRMAEFDNLVRRTHDSGMKVIIDFVPNHVARQYHSDAKPTGIDDLGATDDVSKHFSPNNNFYYIPRQLFSPQIDLGTGAGAYYEFPAKATGNDCFSAFPSCNDWYETVKLNYGFDYSNGSSHFSPIPDTWFKMVNILRFWAAKGIDAFRCDMAFMVPVQFWHWAIPIVKEKYPQVKFIAEIYDTNLYRQFINDAGFDYLYDKVNLYDTLRGIITGGISAATITNCWQAVDGIGPQMLNFLENHDEQRFASFQFAGNAFSAIPALIVSSTINSGPMLIYAGQELGEKAPDEEGFSGNDGRTSIFDYWSISTLRRWFNNGKCDNEFLTPAEITLRDLYSKILNLCNSEKAIASGSFFDLMYVNYGNLNPHRHFVYLRHAKNETILIAVNFDSIKADININIPQLAFDLLNITHGKYRATELISGESKNISISSSTAFPLNIEPFNAALWKFSEKIGKKK